MAKRKRRKPSKRKAPAKRKAPRKSAAAKRRSEAARKGWDTRRKKAAAAKRRQRRERVLPQRKPPRGRAKKPTTLRQAMRPNVSRFMVTAEYRGRGNSRVVEVFIAVRWAARRPDAEDAERVVNQLARGRKVQGVTVEAIQYGHPDKSWRRSNARTVDELAGVILNGGIIGELSED